MKSKPTLSIIIVSYNTKKYTLQTLQSVFTTLGKSSFSAEVIMVENSSTDGSFEAVLETFADKVNSSLRIIQTSQLIGFGAANNLGAEIATGEYLLFLNSDVILQDITALDKLVATIKKNPSTLLSVQLLNEDGSLQFQGGSIPNLVNIFTWATGIAHIPGIRSIIPAYQNSLGPVKNGIMKQGWIGGTALCIKRSIFEELGRWDENIYMYGEDTELCMRAHRSGYESGVILNAQITHLKNKSTGSSAASIINEMKNLVYIFKKHYGVLQSIFLKGILLTGCIERMVYFGILRRDVYSANTYFKAFQAVFMAR